MRAGYEDESLFEQNLLAAQSAGCCWITLHPRTKVDGYRGKARWLLVAQAKSLLSIPVIASGDVTNAQSALDLHALTGCDGIMIGRGAFIDPWIFYRVRAAFLGLPCTLNLQIQRQQLKDLFHFFLGELQNYSESGKLGRLKQVCRFLMQGHPKIQLPFKALLSQQLSCSEMIEVMSSNYEAL
jgi:tRNA-dihydrouridine synthase C